MDDETKKRAIVAFAMAGVSAILAVIIFVSLFSSSTNDVQPVVPVEVAGE